MDSAGGDLVEVVMHPRNVVTVLVCLCVWLVAAPSRGALSGGLGRERISNFKTQLAGTVWKAPMGALRPGLGGMLMFTSTNVESAGYKYEVNTQNSLTLFFNHGDKQVFRLPPDGQHLSLSFKNKTYTYDLYAVGDAADQSNKLAGTTWKVSTKAVRPGLFDTLKFTATTVGPSAYLYSADGADALTVYFDYGDNQPMKVSPDGKRLSFTWKGQEFAYELAGG
jgi:hypothetical protein